MQAIDMDHICFLASDPVSHGFLVDQLSRMDGRIWSEDDENLFNNRFEQITTALNPYPEIQNFFQFRLLTEFMVFPQKTPLWAPRWLRRRLDLSRHLPGMSWSSLEKGRFCAVPVWVCLEKGCRRCFIAGLVPESIPPLPDWAGALMAPSCRKALGTAAIAAGKTIPLPEHHHLFCYPLTVKNQTVQFTGRSLALPLALGFLSLLSGQKGAGHLAATGDLDRDGNVIKIGHLSAKIQVAADGYHGMLYPLANYLVKGPDNFDLIPVDDLASAWMVARLYAGENKKMLDLCLAMLDAPQCFVQNCNMVPLPWLTWIRRHGKDRKIIAKISGSPLLFTQLARALEQSLDKWDLERCRALSDLIQEDVLDQVQTAAPLAVFNWCRLNLALSNHLGKTKGAFKWIDRAGGLTKQVMAVDVATVADYYNHFLVSLHNSYSFPASFPKALSRVLSLLERLHNIRRLEGCPVYPVLGKLYGTLAQHHGFRGPDQIPAMRAYSERARLALGEPSVNEYKNQWLRQYYYLAYACLDAGLFSAAEKHFLNYLAADDLEQAVCQAQNFTIWNHNLAARFLADTDHLKIAAVYLEKAVDPKQNPCKTGHPWQLWSLNMARIAHRAGDNSTAAALYRKSLDLCLEDKSGPAIQVMALMPLAGLKKTGGLDKKTLRDIKQKIMTAVAELNEKHFKILKNKDFNLVIDEIWECPQRLFPFTYR